MRRRLAVLGLSFVVACAPSQTAPPPSTSESATTTSAPATTTTEVPVMTTNTTTPDPMVAWTEAEAERHVENYVAALRAGAYQQAGFSATDAGVVAADQTAEESVADYLARRCANGLCLGQYLVEADGPGLVDDSTGQASSVVTVTHEESGESVQFELGTFEGQLIILDLPPLVPSRGGELLVESLFGSDPPRRVVVQRFDAFEIWKAGVPEWVTHWHAERALEVEGDFVVVAPTSVLEYGVAALTDPRSTHQIDCPRLMTRGDEVLALSQCGPNQWHLVEVPSGEEREIPVPLQPRGDGEYEWFAERGARVVTGIGDAEGNLIRLTTLDGTDLLGDGYAGLASLSTDGRYLAYVDHADPAALSHFWSPVVVAVNTEDGEEIGRWTLDSPVSCLEFAATWVLACEVEDPLVLDPAHDALVAIDIESGAVNRVKTRARVFLPAG